MANCKANDTGSACVSKVCSDYINVEGLSYGSTTLTTDADCSGLDSTCTIDNTGINAC